MREVSIREMRELLPRLEEELAKEGEVVLTRHGKPVARVVPLERRKRRPSHAEFRATMPFQDIPSEVLIREDRDARD
jgi:prevent-host-death family protein